MSLYLQKRLNNPYPQLQKISTFEFLKKQILNPEKVKAVSQEEKDNAMYLISGTIEKEKNGKYHRTNKNIRSKDFIFLDYDELQKHGITHEQFLSKCSAVLKDYDYIIYPTFKASAVNPRFRLAVKLDRPLNQKEYSHYSKYIINCLGFPPDTSSYKNWSIVQGLPIETPLNKDIRVKYSVINEVGASFPTVTPEQFLNNPDMVEREEQKLTDLLHRYNPEKQRISNFNNKEYNYTKRTKKAENDLFLSHTEAIEVMTAYANVEKHKLEDREVYISVLMQLVQSTRNGEITQETAEDCARVIACDNPDWIENNVIHFRKELEKTEVRQTGYDFLGKFFYTLPPEIRQQKRHLAKEINPEQFKKQHEQKQSQATSQAIRKAINESNLNDYNFNNIPKEWRKELTQEEVKQLYLNTQVKRQMNPFKQAIEESINKKTISTGFQQVDKILDGGLYEGLYFIGAISSLGKTTITLQMADSIAKQGIDVLVFSLEMSRYEIMAKSISRETYEISMQPGEEIQPPIIKPGDKPKWNARTVREITDKKRYKHYSSYQKDLINKAYDSYQKYNQNLYIQEGVGDITPEDIRKTIQLHEEVTGNKPVVIIDYLQIIAPTHERGTDKQNLDTAVMYLKQISRDCKIPVLCISSLNRQNYTNHISMSAMSGSSGIEYSSDVLIGLQFTAQTKASEDNKNITKEKDKKVIDPQEEKNKPVRKVDLVLLKQRNGQATGNINFEFIPRFNYFREIQPGEKESDTLTYQLKPFNRLKAETETKTENINKRFK